MSTQIILFVFTIFSPLLLSASVKAFPDKLPNTASISCFSQPEVTGIPGQGFVVPIGYMVTSKINLTPVSDPKLQVLQGSIISNFEDNKTYAISISASVSNSSLPGGSRTLSIKADVIKNGNLIVATSTKWIDLNQSTYSETDKKWILELKLSLDSTEYSSYLLRTKNDTSKIPANIYKGLTAGEEPGILSCELNLLEPF